MTHPTSPGMMQVRPHCCPVSRGQGGAHEIKVLPRRSEGGTSGFFPMKLWGRKVGQWACLQQQQSLGVESYCVPKISVSEITRG